MYRGARRAFGWEGQPGQFGNLRPLGLARELTLGAAYRLQQVRVYTGVPSVARDRRGNAITQRRIAGWVSDSPDVVEVFPRPLSYPPDEGREKGVDVELAIDLVRLAMDNEFDVAFVASADTDLVPPIKFVLERFSDKVVDTVAYEPEAGCEGITAEPIDVPGDGVHVNGRHKIRKHIFEKAIADRRNFVNASTQPSSIVGAPRWQGIARRLGQ